MNLTLDTSPIIGPIEESDWAAVIEMGKLFYQEGQLRGAFRGEVFRRNWEEYIDHGYGHVLCLRRGLQTVGTIGGFITPDPCNDDLIASEAFWFMHPEARGAGVLLLRKFEEYAKQRGAKRLTMVALASLHSARLGGFYQRRGFAPMETHFIKDL